MLKKSNLNHDSYYHSNQRIPIIQGMHGGGSGTKTALISDHRPLLARVVNCKVYIDNYACTVLLMITGSITNNSRTWQKMNMVTE